MDADSIKNLLPHLTEVVGFSWIAKAGERADFFSEHVRWFQQLDYDLGVLAKRLGFPRLIQCFQPDLRNKDFKTVCDTIYEVHGSALLSTAASEINLHVPRGDGSNKNFDARAVVQGTVISADSKTRFDDSLLQERYRWVEDGIDKGYFGERATIDPHDAAEMGIEPRQRGPHYNPTPESTNIRQRLLWALSQLPRSGFNVVIFGHELGDRQHLERALYGSEQPLIVRNHVTKDWHMEWSLTPTGAFRDDEKGEPFRPLSGVLWMRLMTDPSKKFYRSYKLYPNPFASTLLPSSVIDAIEDVCSQWKAESENSDSEE